MFGRNPASLAGQVIPASLASRYEVASLAPLVPCYA